ncbi:MAG: DUF5654 family protein [Patescibacteria group bacterium]
MTAVRNKFKKIAEEQKKIGIQVKEKTSGYILAALGFVVGLAWNDAIRALIDSFFPLDKDSILVKFIYALIVTVIIVVATIILTKKTEQQKAEVEKK